MALVAQVGELRGARGRVDLKRRRGRAADGVGRVAEIDEDVLAELEADVRLWVHDREAPVAAVALLGEQRRRDLGAVFDTPLMCKPKYYDDEAQYQNQRNAGS